MARVLPVRNLLSLGPNEPVTESTINRCLRQLVSNDNALQSKIADVGLAQNLSLWSPKTTYNTGDIVVYIKEDKDDLRTYCYLLMSLSDSNTSVPFFDKTLPRIPDFSDSGWFFIHDVSYLCQNPELLNKIVIQPIAKDCYDSHNLEFHNDVEVREASDFDKVFLKKDLSNLQNVSMTQGSVENYQAEWTDGDSQAKGIYRKCCNGVLIYEFTFGFNEVVNQKLVIEDSKYYLKKSPIFDQSDDTIFSKYYYGEDEELNHILELKNGLQWRKLRYGTNVFSSKIAFPVPFINNEYMVFPGTYRDDQFVFANTFTALARKDQPTKDEPVSRMLIVNKHATDFTAILPLHTFFSTYNVYKVGAPWVNRFSMKIVGRWNDFR